MTSTQQQSAFARCTRELNAQPIPCLTAKKTLLRAFDGSYEEAWALNAVPVIMLVVDKEG